jgi:Putative metallopeptidase
MPGLEVGSVGTVLVRKEWTLVGPFVHEALRDVALAVFEINEIPVWGGTENAADYTAAFLMLQFGSDVAWKTILGSAYFLAVLNDNVVRRGYSFAYLADIRPTLAQRYYNTLCIAVGSDWVKFGMFLPVGREEKVTDLPVRRLGNCMSDYQVLHRAFVKTIVGPYVDPELQKKVLATNWIE